MAFDKDAALQKFKNDHPGFFDHAGFKSAQDYKRAYSRYYRILRREELNEYKRNWQITYRRNVRLGIIKPTTASRVTSMNEQRMRSIYGPFYYRFSFDRRSGHCFMCSLRLDSQWAIRGDDRTCGECLTKYGSATSYYPFNGKSINESIEQRAATTRIGRSTVGIAVSVRLVDRSSNVLQTDENVS